MKLDEFKAWFEGFTESMEAAPTKKQWERIKARVAEIDGTPISYPVYVDRYVRPWYPYWGAINGVGHGVSNNVAGLNAVQANQDSVQYTSALMNAGQNAQQGFDAVTAMYSAGKAEASSFN